MNYAQTIESSYGTCWDSNYLIRYERKLKRNYYLSKVSLEYKILVGENQMAQDDLSSVRLNDAYTILGFDNEISFDIKSLSYVAEKTVSILFSLNIKSNETLTII